MLKEPGKHLLAICSILIPQNPLPEIRQKTNYMAVEKFIFPDGQPEAIVHWQIKSPNTEKSGPIMCFIKSTKCASQTNYLETWKVLEKVYKGEPLPHIEFHLSCLVSWYENKAVKTAFNCPSDSCLYCSNSSKTSTCLSTLKRSSFCFWIPSDLIFLL